MQSVYQSPPGEPPPKNRDHWSAAPPRNAELGFNIAIVVFHCCPSTGARDWWNSGSSRQVTNYDSTRRMLSFFILRHKVVVLKPNRAAAFSMLSSWRKAS